MPQYGQFRYGKLERYGKYSLSTGGSGQGMAIGPYTKYRIRLRGHNGSISNFVTMFQDKVDVPSKPGGLQFRIRANNGEWVYTQNEYIDKQSYNVRIRSISSDGTPSEWVMGDKGDLS